ncbi:unnamed protein product, partial [Allacma fusca]
NWGVPLPYRKEKIGLRSGNAQTDLFQFLVVMRNLLPQKSMRYSIQSRNVEGLFDGETFSPEIVKIIE